MKTHLSLRMIRRAPRSAALLAGPKLLAVIGIAGALFLSLNGALALGAPDAPAVANMPGAPAAPSLPSAPAAVGDHLWSQRFGSADTDAGVGVSVDGADNVLVTGNFRNAVNFGSVALTSAGSDDIFLAKYNSSGTHLWSKRFGNTSGDYGRGVSVDSAGNVLVTGYFGGGVDFGGGTLTSAGGFDIFLAKYNGSGNHLWSRRFGNTSGDYGQGVSVDSAGNVLVTGGFRNSVDFGGGPLTSAGGLDIFLAKYDSSGNLLWSKRFGNASDDCGLGVSVDGAGNVLVTGGFQNSVDFGGGTLTSAGGDDIFLATYSSSGNLLWSKRFGSTSTDTGRGVSVDGAGNVLVTGGFQNSVDFGGGTLTSAGGDDIFLATYHSPSGAYQWAKRIGGTNTDRGVGVSMDGAGNVLVTGHFADSVNFGGGTLTSAGGPDIFLAKYEALAAPDAVTGIRIAAIGGSKARITWKAAAGATGYEVWSAANTPYFTPPPNLTCAAPPAWYNCTVVPAPDVTYDVALGDPANNYTYRVRAVNASGASPLSAPPVGEFEFSIVPGGF